MSYRKRNAKTLFLAEQDFCKIIGFILKDEQRVKLKGKLSFVKIRDATMLFVAYALGLRPGETTKIRMQHLDLEDGILFIPAENNKQRYSDNIPLPSFIIDRIFYYLKLKNKFYEWSPFLFPNVKGAELSRGNYEKMFRKYLKKTELYQVNYIDKKGLNRANINLYSLRKSFGTRVWDKTRDILKTSIALRHRDRLFRTVMAYINYKDGEIKKIFDEVYPEKIKT